MVVKNGSYIKGGVQAKGTLNQNPEKDISVQEE
jgi:hypothetical protein